MALTKILLKPGECLGGSEHFLFMQRTWVWVLAPTWWLKTSLASVSEIWHPLLISIYTRHARGVQIHIRAKYPYTYNKLKNLSKIVFFNICKLLSTSLPAVPGQAAFLFCLDIYNYCHMVPCLFCWPSCLFSVIKARWSWSVQNILIISYPFQ